MTEILQQDIQQLLEYFSQNLYSAKSIGDEYVQRCSELMRMDYTVVDILNANGELTPHYPAKLLIPEKELKNGEDNPGDGSTNGRNGDSSEARYSPVNRDQVLIDGKLDGQRLRHMILGARYARCRGRFPAPVILYNGKYVCRSATLSGGPEIYGRSGLEYLIYAGESTECEEPDETYEAQEEEAPNESDTTEWPLFGKLRKRDIRLLKALNVGTIIDFMVENKKVKFFINVTSSEKVDKENRYSFFKILALPYPGCEFFRQFRDRNLSGRELIFDWNQSYVDAKICIPEDSVTAHLNIDWRNYKQWDLVQITQNYLRLLLKSLQESSSGILVHCISGWDRTPLFVSLLRISLWADGAIHQSFDTAQMLYFTIAYDWLLFGHDLPDRLSKGEAIFYFCFYMLKYIVDVDYTVLTRRFRSQTSSASSSSIEVIRTDSDTVIFDGLMLDGEERGSSASLNSASSYTSGRSSSMHDTQTCTSTGIELTSRASSNSIAITSRNGNTRNGGGGSGNAPGSSVDENVNSLNGNNGFLAHSHSSNSSIGGMSHDSSNHNNQWSPKAERTSPVTVPSANRLRQRQESTSSISGGSWQLVEHTGSYRSTDSLNVLHSHLQQNPGHDCRNPECPRRQQAANQTSNSNASPFYPQSQSAVNSGSSSSASTTPNANQHHPSQESNECCTLFEGLYYPSHLDRYARRRERLTQLRALFFNCYHSTIAFNFNSSSSTGRLGSLMGNFADKVRSGGNPPSA